MISKLLTLQNKRIIKLKEYNATSTNSWKKRLRRLELQILDSQINREKLIRQFQ